ncbi:lysosomal-trafficking regulator [Anabrus simplex]|uniref:lysosomal-trafficking regulator n=1 Tax=Anabrus simplex TaxID=316456 RepID=UPI0035A29B84
MTAPSKIQQLWEFFIQAEHSSYEKSSWLDVFLAEFLAQVHEGNDVEDILSFCLVGGVATLIGCELLADVHQICSQPGDGEDLTPLRHHLLRGRGWRCLAALHCLGVQNLSCGRELASLLISLYPVCLQTPNRSRNVFKNPYILNKKSRNIEDIFKTKTPLKHKFRTQSHSHNLNLCPPTRVEFNRSFSNSSTSRPRRLKASVNSDGGRANGEVTSESEQPGEDFDTLPGKASTLKIRLDPMDFDYFTSVVRSEDEARLDSHNYTPLKREGRDKKKEVKKFPDDFKDERVQSVLKSEICNYEFFQLVIQLLQSLCANELSVSSDNAHQITVQAINFALENLCSLQFGSAPTEAFTFTEVAELKCAMTQLLLTALEKVLMHPDVTMTVIRNGMLPVTLKVLEDAICKMSAAVKVAEEEETSSAGSLLSNAPVIPISQEEACKIQEFIFGTMYGIVTFIYCLLLQRCTVDKFRDFLELFQLFSDSHNGRLVEKTVTVILSMPHVEPKVSKSRAKKVIDLVGQLIAALKKVRSEIIHSHQCRRVRHKQCINGVGLATHHHHDLFGTVFSTSIVGPNIHQACCISTLFMILVRLLNTRSVDIESRVIKVMMMCGTCCCFPARNLMTTLVEVLKRGGSHCRTQIFTLLEKRIYSELGAVVTQDSKITCIICNKNTDNAKLTIPEEIWYETAPKRNITKDFQSGRNTPKSDSEKLTSISSLENGGVRNSWSCFELYHDLLQSSDVKLCHSLTSHLLKVSPRCTASVKYELLFKVFYPTFCAAKIQFLSQGDDVSKFTVLSCLSIFSSLLGSITFAEQFISQDGLNHILDLISLTPFSKLCCSVLEMAAIIEMWKLECDAKYLGLPVNDKLLDSLKKLPSLCMLQDAVGTSTRLILSILDKYSSDKKRSNLIMPSDIGELTTEDPIEMNDNTIISSTPIEGDMNMNVKAETNEIQVQRIEAGEEEFSSGDKVPAKERESYRQLLANVCVFWRSCANLAVYSPQYRQHLACEPVSKDGYRLMSTALKRIVQGNFLTDDHPEENQIRGSESYLYLRLIEATLTVNLAAPTVLDESDLPVSCEEVVKNLEKILLSVDLNHNVNVRHLCEVLLRCAVAECCQEQVMPPNRKPKLPPLLIATTWDESLSDAEEDLDTNELSEECSSLDDTYITADEGYEADIELLDGHRMAGPADDSSSTAGIYPPTMDSKSGGGSAWSDYGKNHNIVHPSLCTLVIELIVHLNQRYYESSPKANDNRTKEINGNDTMWSQKPDEALHLQNMVHCIQRLVALCRDNPQNCVVLAKNSVITKLLEGFSDCLATTDLKLAELQRIVLELVALLAKHSITPQELALYLSFFKEKDPPLDALLGPLSSLVTASRPQPNYILCFPVEPGGDVQNGRVINCEGQWLFLSLAASQSSDCPIGEDRAGSLANSLNHQHVEAGVQTCWSSCALSLPINQDLGWSMWLHGFSMALWLRVERGSNTGGSGLVRTASYPSSLLSDSTSGSISDWGIASDHWNKESKYANESVAGVKPVSTSSALHIFSIGYETLVLEMWSDPCADTLTLKLTRPDPKGSETFCESIVENCLSAGQWHHLAVSVRDFMQNRKVVIEVTLLINGWREVKVLMTYSGLLVRKSRATCLLLGHSVSGGQPKPSGSWYFGNVMLFRCPVFTKERAVYLVGLGPNFTNLTDCEVDRVSPNFTSVFGPKTLFSGIDWETILDGKKGNLKELQDNLLLTYSAQQPHVVNLYPQVVSNPGAAMVGSLFPGQPGFRVVTMDQRASQQLPLTVSPTIFAALNTQQYQGLVAAASILGGTPVFLFLFARVVELRANQEAQAKALYLLLKLVQADSELFSQFVNQDCHKLLLKVLSSPRCIAGHHILKAVLDTCCDKPVLQYHPGPRKFHIAHQSDAIIVNSFLLSTIVGSWRDWERAGEDRLFDEGGGVLGTLFRTLHVLLRDDHPFREFNATQLNRVHMVEALLLFCKERFLYEESLQLHSSVCCSLVELIRSLMGAPPEFSHVVAVTDFLVLLHQASSTYITHVRPSFYFLLSHSPPSSPAVSTNNKSIVSRSSSAQEKLVLFQLGDAESNGKINNRNSKDTKDNFAQPVDPQKLNKALTNLQIKQSSGDTTLSPECNNTHQKENRSASLPMDSNKVDDLAIDSGIAGSYKETNSASEQDIIRKPSVQSSLCSEISNNKLMARAETINNMCVVNSEDVTKKWNKEEGKKLIEEIGGYEKFTMETEEVDLNSSWLDEDTNTPLPVSDGEKWNSNSSQCLVVEGLLLLLRDTLLVLPDNMAHQVLNHVVRAESLLVMSNHADPRVRTAVVKVLSAYLQRSTDEEINKFLKIKGFYQLANQLSQFPATLELVEACVALVTRCSVSLEEQCEMTSLAELSFLQTNSFPPLLALLPRSVHDTVLSHNLILFLREVFTKVSISQSIRSLLDCGLLESLERTLMAVAHLPPEPSDLCGITEQDLLIGDLHVFLVTIVGQVLHTAGAHHMQVISDMQLQLGFIEKMERSSCGVHSHCVTVARDTQCIILDGALDILQDKISTLQQPGSKLRNTSSFLSSVLSANYDDQFYQTNYEHKSAARGGHTSSSSSSSFSSIHSSFNARTNLQSKEVPRSEINERLKNIITKAVDFLTNVELEDGRSPVTSAIEHNFTRRLFSVLLQGLTSVLEKRSSGQRSAWSGVMWAIRETLRVQCANLTVWLLSPVQPIKMRLFVVHTLRSEQHCKELVTAVLHTHPQIEQKFTLFLWELLHSEAYSLSPLDIRACEELQAHLQPCGVLEEAALPEEVRLLLEDRERQRVTWEKQNESATSRSVYKFEGLMKAIAESAMNITRTVVEAQNSERKVFMEHIKMAYSENVQIRIKWQKILQQLTHERAVWFFPESYSRSWQLDSTEGPGRVRNRLQRCHLGVKRKYLIPCAQKKLDAVTSADPLSFLFEKDNQSSVSTVLIERLHTNEKIQHMCTARVITPANEVPGELLIGESCLYFVADDSVLGTDLSEVTAGSLDVSSTAWHFENVKEIHNRRFQLQDRALEIFLLNGKTYLVAFQTSKDRDTFVLELSQCHLPNRVAGDNLSDAVQMWREGLITNWEYLTQLNKMAGRSYNDLMQYPVFPFVLADYTSQTLDLLSPQSYRNFKRPMAVQDKKNEQHYINNYNYLKQELMEGQRLVTLNYEPYHYGSHYSNSGTVLHFLVRLPPFTRMFLTYQDNNFDLPDRTFHSLYTTWRLTSSDSTTDVKELIPEFFFLPEFLLNSEGFNFGVRQNGERVHHVALPPWCKGDPRYFILVHRQALESDYVRENLPHWIDLVFGYKQTGKMAVDAINVFHPATYYGFNVEAIEDPLERIAWETMVKTYGQTPRQLFRSAHPMVVQSLSSRTALQSVREVIPTVKGLRWGSYVGSPADSDPVVVWKHQHRNPVATLVPLLTNDVFGLAPQTSLLLCYSKEKGLSMVNTTSVLGAALVTWGHSDSIVRVKLKKEQPPWPIIRSSGLDPICICASMPDCNQLWIGHLSGKLVVYEYKFDPSRGLLEFRNEPVTLLGHTGTIHSLYICRSFSIVVSGSEDGTAIAWDLNNLSYVRSIPCVGTAIRLVSVSETIGDIATVSNSDSGSSLRLYTINTALVGNVSTKVPITAICFSSAPEGVSVNVVATGLSTGTIRLWSTWDLTLVREITSSFLTRPIISLTYSQDSQHLYASASDGIVIIWEGAGAKGVSKTPKFLNLTSL